ncbi:MAG: HAD family phosphatase [Selenomonadaceae bacterium]|nr:HAD family phosphatase [Selenomonadaceae bacterium]
MKYRLLALDMDGTVLNSQKKISPQTVAAIKKLSESGVYVVTSTGRGRAEVNDYPDVINLMNCGILNSGGLLFDFVRDEPIAIHGVDEKIILKLIDFGLEERAMIHLLGIRHSIAREEDIQNMAAFDMAVYHDMFNRICERCADPKEYVLEHPGEVIKVNLYHRDKISRDKNFERIKPLNLSISFAESNNLEMSPANITKASGLIELCDFLKIDLAETVAIGDADNDKEILQTAGLSVAMGNASDEIKKLADFVTLDNDHDGVAAAIEKFFKE